MMDAIPYLLLVFVLDNSGSMQNAGIKQLRQAMEKIISQAKEDRNAEHIIFGLVLFNEGIITEVLPTPVLQFELPNMIASGYTDLGLAVTKGMNMAQQWKDSIAKDLNKKRYCPSIILLSDGAPCLDSDTERNPITEYIAIADKAREASVTDKDNHHFHFVPVACGSANKELLSLLREDKIVLDAGADNYNNLELVFEKIVGSIPQMSSSEDDPIYILTTEQVDTAEQIDINSLLYDDPIANL